MHDLTLCMLGNTNSLVVVLVLASVSAVALVGGVAVP